MKLKINESNEDKIVIDKALEEEIKGAIEDGGYEVEISYFRGNELYLNVKFIDVPDYLYHQNTQYIEEILCSVASDIEDNSDETMDLDWEIQIENEGVTIITWLIKYE